jgi:uncharacterized repeat protein (TIGR03803 family)
MQSKKSFSAGKPTFVIFMTLMLVSAIVPTQAQAQKFKVLHTFHGANGAGPEGQLVRDAAGDIYGTASAGGAGICDGGHDCGTAFKLDKTGKQVWQHNFAGKNGFGPSAGLLRDAAGSLYGTTVFGGNTRCSSLGCGTVFKLDSGGGETVLHKFTGTNGDGFFPEPLLARDDVGNLYGTTSDGGGLGMIFKIDKTGKETVLYDFTGGSDGCFPDPGVILDTAGNLYGVAFQGGAGFCNSGYGVVFELDTSGELTVLHTFGGGDGAYPNSVLLFDSSGNLYGTTKAGGSSTVCGGGCGTVFELSPQPEGSWTESVLYSFCSLSSCADGEEPFKGPLIRDAAGNLYGTAYFGGTYDDGVVFKLDATGKETILHTFTGGADGAGPAAGVIVDKAGNLYGTTAFGGDRNCALGNGAGCGVVFKLIP